jgi:hypothetical protein
LAHQPLHALAPDPLTIAPAKLEVTYLDGRGILREALGSCTKAGFAVADLAPRHVGGDHHAVAVRLELPATARCPTLPWQLDSIDGVLAVSAASEEGRELRLSMSRANRTAPSAATTR